MEDDENPSVIYTVAPPGAPPPSALDFETLMKTVEAIRDRMPHAPNRVRMCRAMCETVARDIERRRSRSARNGGAVTPDFGPDGRIRIHLGVEIYINDDLPFGEWEEWDGEQWRPRNPLGL